MLKPLKHVLGVCRENPVIVWVAGFCVIALVMVMLALWSTL